VRPAILEAPEGQMIREFELFGLKQKKAVKEDTVRSAINLVLVAAFSASALHTVEYGILLGGRSTPAAGELWHA